MCDNSNQETAVEAVPAVPGQATVPTPLQMERHFTAEGVDPYDSVVWSTFRCRLKDDRSGDTIFDLEVEAPAHWTQASVDIVASKYFRKTGVPQVGDDGHVLVDEEGRPVTGGETSVRQVVHRLAGTWAHWGREIGYLTEETRKVFYDEIVYMLLWQLFAPNSPQWFNTGLWWAYGIDNDTQAHYYVNPDTGVLEESTSRYQRPSPFACYIGHVDDKLVGDGSIYDLLAREGRIFQSGAGSGANFSALRAKGEALSGGGVSSGMMSFLRVFDRAAGAIQSGGTTRRAAKMVVVDMDHPEVIDFINWKVKEEDKVRALVAAGYDADWRGEAYDTVSGQNSNNSISISAEFMKALSDDADWHLTARRDGAVMRTVPARELWNTLAEAAWKSADPGVQFVTTMNDWHTTPHVGPIRATNPCSEYMQVDDSACNLASLRLTAFYGDDDLFKVADFVAATRLATIVLEISVAMGQLPDRRVAWNTYNLRNLGLGYADLGALLMRSGLPYDSDEGRAAAGAVTSLMTAVAWETSAQMAKSCGTYGYYHREHHMRVVHNHHAAHVNGEFEGLSVTPQAIRRGDLPSWAGPVYEEGAQAWERAIELGDAHGYRNGQVTVLAPTGTISFAMGCDTTGVEPDFALVKYKKLAGGGSMMMVNQGVSAGLKNLGYGHQEIADIIEYVDGNGTVEGAPHIDGNDAHKQVFDTAVGERSIAAEGHVRMLGAIAPFLSGSASKTVNLPQEAQPEDIAATNLLAYELGVKCVAVYRDGTKMSQPLNTSAEEDSSEAGNRTVDPDELEAAMCSIFVPSFTGVSPRQFWSRFGLDGGPRFRLEPVRRGKTWEIKVGGAKFFLRTGEYEDGTLGEIFLDLAKEGATLRGVMSCFAIAVSQALQSGVPLRRIVDSMAHQTFEPRGIVEGHANIKMSSSMVDAVARILGFEYLGDTSLVHVKPQADQMLLVAGGVEAKEVTTAAVGDHTPNLRLAEHLHHDIAQGGAGRSADTAHAGDSSTKITGEMCTMCGAPMVRTGTCLTCPACGHNLGGCS